MKGWEPVSRGIIASLYEDQDMSNVSNAELHCANNRFVFQSKCVAGLSSDTTTGVHRLRTGPLPKRIFHCGYDAAVLGVIREVCRNGRDTVWAQRSLCSRHLILAFRDNYEIDVAESEAST